MEDHYYYTMSFGHFLDILFPRTCVHCSKNIPSGAICEDCFARIPLYKTLSCSECGAAYPLDDHQILPGHCHSASYRLGAAVSYDTPAVAELIHALKFGSVKAAAEPLADLLIRYVAGIGIDLGGYAVVPIPLSRRRLFARGWNQSALIAHTFADHYGLRVRRDLLFRKKHRKAQSETKNVAERRRNIIDCFAVRQDAHPVPHSILLVDDVTTSGATLREAVRVLRTAGAVDIFALVVAKA